MVALVPVRKRRRLDNTVRLGGDEIYGREKLLNCLGQACGCQKKCSECRRVAEWVKHFLSREALKIQGNVLQIKGINTCRLLHINDKTLQLDGVDETKWMGSIVLNLGSRISFKVPNNPSDTLEFEVVDDNSHDGIETFDKKKSPDIMEEAEATNDIMMETVPLQRRDLHHELSTKRKHDVCDNTGAAKPPGAQFLESDVGAELNGKALEREAVIPQHENVTTPGIDLEKETVVPQHENVTTCGSDLEKKAVIPQHENVTSSGSPTESLADSMNNEEDGAARSFVNDQCKRAAVAVGEHRTTSEGTPSSQQTPQKELGAPMSPQSWNTPRMLAQLESSIEKAAKEWDTSIAAGRGGDQNRHAVSKALGNELVRKVGVGAVAKPEQSSPKVLDLTKEFRRPATPVARIQQTASAKDKGPSILFVQLGRELTSGRIKTLSNVVKKKGATVVTKLDHNPTYLVIPANVKVETLATHFGFKSAKKVEKLQRIVSERRITLVKPLWIVNNKGHQLKTPKLTELYNGLVIAQPKVRKHVARPTGPQSQGESDGCVSEVPVNGGLVVRNVAISGVFRHLAKLYQKAQVEDIDEFRAYTFNLIAGRLALLDFEIANDPMAVAKLREVRGIGASTLDLIKEWLRTGKIQRIHALETEEQRVAIANLIRIWGVGPKMARHLYTNGFGTIDRVRRGLRHGKIDLSTNQQIGVECYEDFQLKMTREEVEEICNIIRNQLETNFPNATIDIMGSYRRGKKECGDGDFLILDSSYVNGTPLLALGELVRKLKDQGHIAYHLTHIPGIEKSKSDSQSSEGRAQPIKYELYRTAQSYMGVFNSPVFKGVRRRIDIKFYPYRERAFAYLYFTGCGWFNRSMRLWASRKKSWTLNDHGLFPDDRRATHNVPGPDEQLLLEATSESHVFDALGLVYKQPHERNCFDDVVSKEGETVASLDISDAAVRKASRRNESEAYCFLDD